MRECNGSLNRSASVDDVRNSAAFQAAVAALFDDDARPSEVKLVMTTLERDVAAFCGI